MHVALREVLHYCVLSSVSFLRCTVAGHTRRMSGRGSGGSTPSDITTTINNLVAQSKPAINLSVMN
jgi:hypothetical protein